jgi:membrane-associated protease RseP (regulator of RpoE activity)
MEQILCIALGVILLLLSVFLHEMGHAYYMWKYGIRIKTVSLGFSCPVRLRFTTKKFLGGTTLQFTPLVFGAFVEPLEADRKKLDELPYKQRLDIYSAGPYANFLYAGIMVIVSGLLIPTLTLEVWVSVGFAAFCTLLLYLARKIFFRYLAPIFGILLLGLLTFQTIRLVTLDREDHKQRIENLRKLIAEETSSEIRERLQKQLDEEEGKTKVAEGPVAIVRIFGEILAVRQAFFVAGFLSFSIALLNLLPLGPLDGAGVIGCWLRQLWGKDAEVSYRTITLFIFLVIICYTLYTDFLSIF